MTSPSPFAGARRLALVLSLPGLALLLALAGCRAAPADLERSAQSSSIQQRTASPAVWGADRGLELVTWIVADSPFPLPGPKRPVEEPDTTTGEPNKRQGPLYTIIDNRLSIQRALAAYADRPLPISDDLRFRWHAAGFRLVAVPVDDLPRIQRSLRLVGPTQRQWLGEMPQWTDLVRGPQFDVARTVALDSGNTYVEPGRLRLLARAWIVPDPSGQPGSNGFIPAAMRFEAVPQHEPQLSEPHRLLAGANNTAAEAQGRLFPRLALGLYLRADEALVIVPDDPDSDWSAAPSAADPEQEDTVRFDPESLGEAMLAMPGAPNTPRTRGIIVLIPHIPQRYELR